MHAARRAPLSGPSALRQRFLLIFSLLAWPRLRCCVRSGTRGAAAGKPDTKPEEEKDTETERTQRQSQTHSLGAHRDGASFHMQF